MMATTTSGTDGHCVQSHRQADTSSGHCHHQDAIFPAATVEKRAQKVRKQGVEKLLSTLTPMSSLSTMDVRSIGRNPELLYTLMRTSASILLLWFCWKLNARPKDLAVSKNARNKAKTKTKILRRRWRGKSLLINGSSSLTDDNTTIATTTDDDNMSTTTSDTTNTNGSIEQEPASNSLLLLDAQLVEKLEEEAYKTNNDDDATTSNNDTNNITTTTRQERYNFLKGNQYDLNKTAQKLKFTYNWRNKLHSIANNTITTIPDTTKDPIEIDQQNWIHSMQIAAKYSNDTKFCATTNIPKFIRHTTSTTYLTDAKQAPLFLLLPGLIDPAIAELSTYRIAIAWYLHITYPNANTKLSLVIDLRPGQGWRNCHAITLLSTIQEGIQLLTTIFPERLCQCIITPIPKSYYWLWKRCIQPYLDASTKRKIGVICGAHAIDAMTPIDELTYYMDRDMALALHEERLSEFR
mmetsp:Transcript_10260/g.29265  ORF Transcript_10260/g.29265 Transcript_10260/m.29265 type:complete len:465 (+) Transcript_10260:91-1485(+)